MYKKYVMYSKHVCLWCCLAQQMENIDAERDIYDELLTQAEIQGNVNKVNGKPYGHGNILDFMLCMHRLSVTFNHLLRSGKCN